MHRRIDDNSGKHAVSTVLGMMAAAGVLVFGAQALDGDGYVSAVFATMERAMGNITQVANHRSPLAQGEALRFNFNAETGKTYHIAAVCAENCSEIDLEVFAGSVSVRKDEMSGSHAFITFVAVRPAVLTVAMTMSGCAAPRCHAGAKVYFE